MVSNIQENGRIAREMCELGLWKEVLAFAQQWHMEDPKDYLALYYIGLGFTGLNQFRKAEAAYRRALAIDPSAVKVWNNLAGLLYEHMNCESEGIRCMEQSLKLDPNHKLGWSNLATMVGQLGHHDKAIAYADRAIALDPELVEAHLHKGRAALALGKMEIVQEVCQILSLIKPEKFRRLR
jgi:protein O-GlcNAc transferase